MLTHRRRRSILTAFALYTLAALFIGYFAVNAFTGDHGLRAQQDLDQQMAAMKVDLARVRSERAVWERRVSLLRSDRLDPDMIEERARALLDEVDPHDVTLLLDPH
ncbi:MAG: FtsB family cell division protein [Pseudolabrys sp.]